MACSAVLFLMAWGATPAMAESTESSSPSAQGPASSDGDAGPSPQALSATVGLEMGAGGTTPGGLRLAGAHLYQLSASDWLMSEIAVTYGTPGAECVADEAGDLECDHGLIDGVAVSLGAGVRHYFPSQGAFSPFAVGGLSLRLVSFPSDDLAGGGAVVMAGGGIRAVVADGVAVTGGATLCGGVAFLGRGVGAALQASLVIAAGAELDL